MAFRSGFVALIGAPNTGKSTLLNHYLGRKISIISKKPQTTRFRVLGIKHLPEAQIIFIDTPGIHEGKTHLNRLLFETAKYALKEADLILWIVDITDPDAPENGLILKILIKETFRTLLVLNKIDLLPREQLLPLIEKFSSLYDFSAIVPLSALKGENTRPLLDEIIKALPEGPAFYPEHMLSDVPREQAFAEIVREKILWFTHQEIPHAVAVMVEEIKSYPDRSFMDISATILVERSSQKAIVIGKAGQMIKKIGANARKELEAALSLQVNLRLWVKVEKNWRGNPKILRKLGLVTE